MREGRYEMFMALRYLQGMQGKSKSGRFLRFVTYVAVGGVAVGVAALLLALSITRGFRSEIETKIIEFGAHVQVENMQDAPLSDADSLARRLSEMPGVRQVIPVVEELALIDSRTQIDGVGIRGTSELLPLLQDNLVEGVASFADDSLGRPGMVLSRRLARQLEVGLGDAVTGFSMRSLPYGGEGGLSRLFARPRVRQFHVSGIYDSGLVEFDERYAFTDLDAARRLLGYGENEVSRFDLMIEDPGKADQLSFDIELALGFPILARSIYQVHRNLFDWVNLQQSIIPLVVGVIILVAAMNIIGILLMVVLEKTREIGILRSMGATTSTVRRVFLWLGLLIGVAGLCIGEVSALGFALVQQRYGLIPVPEETYYMTTAPVELNLFDFVVVALLTIPLCLLAAYVPARVASRTDPVRSIRFAS